MLVSIRYVTRFVYPTPVWESQNVVRACPRTDDFQELIHYNLKVEPSARIFSYVDHWGTRVDSFGIGRSHSELVVDAAAEVRTSPRTSPNDAPFPTTDRYREHHWLYLQPTRHTRWTAEIAETVASATASLDDAVEAVATVEKLVHEKIQYRPGATSVGVDPAHVWEKGEGVCQDFAHMAVGMLRSVGIAARYVSGYLYARDPSSPDEAVDEGMVVQTHAWVEAALPDWGWWAFDPTNLAPVGERHIVIGHGRDYDDVTPLRGVYYGDSTHLLAAEVTMSTRRIETPALPQIDQ